MTWFQGFELRTLDVNGVRLAVRTGGLAGAPPLLLLHGFPQTHALWHRVALPLASRYQLVMPDLRGYGDSSKPASTADHAQQSKRVMAQDVLALMRALGHARFHVAGHDRGGRVAHRLALDAPAAVDRLALLDIAPTLDMYERTDRRFATLYHHWFHLIQPAPLPERMVGADPLMYLHRTLGGWGGPDGLAYIEPAALAEYERCFSDAEAIRCMCEDYRAAAGIDLEHDQASREAGQRIASDTLLVWGARGVVARLYDVPALWQPQCDRPVRTHVLEAGHFLPEERPRELAAALLDFFG